MKISTLGLRPSRSLSPEYLRPRVGAGVPGSLHGQARFTGKVSSPSDMVAEATHELSTSHESSRKDDSAYYVSNHNVTFRNGTSYRGMTPKDVEEYLRDTVVSTPKVGGTRFVTSAKKANEKARYYNKMNLKSSNGRWLYNGKNVPFSAELSKPRPPSPDGSDAGFRGHDTLLAPHAGMYGSTRARQDPKQQDFASGQGRIGKSIERRFGTKGKSVVRAQRNCCVESGVQGYTTATEP